MAYKQFSANTLTSSEVNQYLMNQTVMVFADSVARDLAIPTPTTGMVVYLTNEGALYLYTGSTWSGLRSKQFLAYSDGVFETNSVVVADTTNSGYSAIQLRKASDSATAGLRIRRDNSSGNVNIFNSTTSGYLFLGNGNTGNGLYLDANNKISMPYQPRFLVYTGGYNHPSSWADISTLGGTSIVDYNVGSHWNASTGLFTAPIDGYYLFYAGGWANYNGAGNRYAIAFHINTTLGGDWKYISGANTSAVDSPLAMSPVIRYMQSGWYMRTCMFSSVGMQLGTSSHKFYYGGHLLG